jgi:hypothetical protein
MREAIEARERFMREDVARLANEIQAAGEPSRTAALQEAERLQAKFGTGLTIGELK